MSTVRHTCIIALAVIATLLVPAATGSCAQGAPAASASPNAASPAAVSAVVSAAAGASAQARGHFVVWGDGRNDAGQTAASPGFVSLVRALKNASFSHSITVGDYTYADGGLSADTARYESFLAAARPLTDGRKTHWIVGNHEHVYDADDDQLYHEKLWGEDAPATAGHGLHHWGAFRMIFGTKRVFGYYLSSAESTAGEGTIGFKTAVVDRAAGSAWRTQSSQARDLVRWLKDRGRRQWVVIVVHHPLYDAKVDDPWDTTAYASEKMKLVRLFRRYGVDLVLQGDVHNYRRHVRKDGSTYLTQGMGGASPKPDRHTAAEPSVPYLDAADRGHLGSPGGGQYRYGWTSFAVLSTGGIRGSTYYVSTIDETVGGNVIPAGTRILYERFALTNVLRTAP